MNRRTSKKSSGRGIQPILEGLENRLFLSAASLLDTLRSAEPAAQSALAPPAAAPLVEPFGTTVSPGAISAWGDNSQGQLTVPTGDNFVAVSSGFSYGLALRSDGSLAAWGANDSNQLTVPTGTGYKAMAAGGRFGVAIKADGSLAAWGDNTYGQCNVPAGNNFTAVSAGSNWGLALRSDGTVLQWGSDSFGNDLLAAPTDSGYVGISCGNAWGMAVKANGHITAWGTGLGAPVSSTPTDAHYTAVAAGLAHGLAIKTDGSLYAWGDDDFGETDVPAGNNFIAISAKGLHSVALRSDGTIVAWGDDSYDMNTVGSGLYTAVAAGTNNTFAVQQAPAPVAKPAVITLTQGTLTYTENAAPLAIDPALTLTAGTTLTGATVSVTNFVSGEDTLSFTASGGITGIFSGGILTLSGSASLAAYQTVLRSVKYSNSSQTPSTLQRVMVFTVNNGTNNSDPASRVVGVVAVNDQPTAQAQSVAVDPGTSLNITLAGSDAETAAANLLFNVPTTTAHGTLTLVSHGLYSYHPNQGYAGPDSFTYTVTDTGDPAGNQANALTSAPATITINVNYVNDAPVAQAQTAQTTRGVPVTLTLIATDAETAFANLIFHVPARSDHGALSATGTQGQYQYTPDAGYAGPDSFDYTVTDTGDPAGTPGNVLTSDPVTVSITVAPINTAPVAQAQSVQTGLGTPVTFTLSATDAETSFAGLIFNVPARSTHGTLTRIAQGEYSYTPDAGFIGSDSFAYSVTDTGDPGANHAGPLTSADATVTLLTQKTLTLNAKGTQTYRDSRGTLVTVKLSGGGHGTLYFNQDGNADLDSLVLTGTTHKSSLKITTAGKGSFTTLGDITTNGPLGSIKATTSNLKGEVSITGPTVIGTAALAKLATAITFARVSDSSIESSMPVKSLKVGEWLDTDATEDLISAPWIGKISAKGKKGLLVGNFMADIDVLASGPKNVSLSSLTVAGWLDSSTITSHTIIGKVKVGGMRDSDILSGVADGVIGLPDPMLDFNSQAVFAAVNSVTISGKVRDASNFSTLNDVIAAPVVAHVTFSYAKFDNGGTDWGVAMNAEPTAKQVTYIDANGKHTFPLTSINLKDMEFLSR